VILRDPHASDQDFLALAEHLGLHGVTYFVGWSAWLDIAPAGADKATALADVAARLGVDRRDVLALGDGRNDLEMLRWAGRGVAMADAPPEVQQAADHVTCAFHDGGTVQELSRWFS
jgi:hydroxymethylpyrimidine pyrophosphatase-like HAD family hydrolase